MSLVAVVGIALVVIFAAIFGVFQYSLSDAPPKPAIPEYSEFTLNEQLVESKEKLDLIRKDFSNGRYDGDLPVDDAIKIIEDEIKLQKQLYDDYQNLRSERKTSLAISEKFFTLGKDWLSKEDSMIRAMKLQISSTNP